MNKKVTTLYIKPSVDGRNTNRQFRVFFTPDPQQDLFVIGMTFDVISVNRATGEVRFAQEHANSHMPKEDPEDGHIFWDKNKF